MTKETDVMDTFLGTRVNKYDNWLSKGQISASSKVIPVRESFEAKQWVLPSEQALEILGNADRLLFRIVNVEPIIKDVTSRWRCVFC